MRIKIFIVVLGFALSSSLDIGISFAENYNSFGQFVHMPPYRPNPQDSSQYLRIPPDEFKSVGIGEESDPEPFTSPYTGKPRKPRQKAREEKEKWKPFHIPPAKEPHWDIYAQRDKFSPLENVLPFYFVFPLGSDVKDEIPFKEAPQMIPDGKGGWFERDPGGRGWIHHMPRDKREFNYLPPCETEIIKNGLTTVAFAVAGKVLLKAIPKILTSYFGAAAASLSNAVGVFIIPVIDQEKIMYPGMQSKEKMTACLLNAKGKSPDVALNSVDGEKDCYEYKGEDGNPYLICCDEFDIGALGCSVENL